MTLNYTTESREKCRSINRIDGVIMKTTFLILVLMTSAACGKGDQSPPSGDGLASATFTQENGFIDAQVCGQDLHVLNGIVYNLVDANSYSQTDNTNYQPISDGAYLLPQGGAHGHDCWFYITDGSFDQKASLTAPAGAQ